MRVSTVENASPEITVMAIGVRISAPSPNPSAIGMRPSTVVNVVMRIGRSRTLPATSSACSVP